MLLMTKLFAALMLVVGGFFSRKQAPVPGNQYDLDYTLLNLSPVDPFTVRHAAEGVAIFGAVGSGKTSGSGATLARAYMDAGMGGLVLCVKPDERALWQRYAHQTGRGDSLIIVSPTSPWRFNILRYILKRPGMVGSRVEALVKFCTTVLDVAKRGEKSRDGEQEFWNSARDELLRNGIELCIMARGDVSWEMLDEIFSSLPRSDNEVQDPAWHEQSLCYRLIMEADARERTSRQQSDYELTARFFLQKWLTYPQDTRGSVLATWGVFAGMWLRGTVAELFSTETNFIPEVSFTGAMIVIDMPVRVYGEAGRFVQAAFKYVWEIAAEQRDVEANPRPAFLWADEAHELVTDYDMQFLTTARSSRVCTVFLSQNLSNYYAALGGETGRHRAEGIFGGLGMKIMHANGHNETNKWASELFQKAYSTRFNFSNSRGHQDNSTGGGSESLESKILPAEFTMLAKGGPENGFQTEAIIFQGGRVFRATGDTYLRAIFRQIR